MKQLLKLYDDVQSGSITKDDFLSDLRKIRAFSKEDRLKLQIIDASPFTIWACGIDNKIRLWEHRCQELYGYTYEEAINKSFIELFVAPDERIRAELDCNDIIKKNKYIINLAGDINKYNNLIFLMTNCFKVTDTDINEDLQAEIGLQISNSDWERLNHEYGQIIETNKKLDNKRAKYIAECDEFYEQCNYRIDELKKDIRRGQVEAVKQESHDVYKQKTYIIRTSLETCRINLDKTTSNNISNINKAKTEDELEIQIREIRKNLIEISDEIENFANDLLQLQITLAKTDPDATSHIKRTEIVSKKDIMMDVILSKKVELLNKIENKINILSTNMEMTGIKDSTELKHVLEQRYQRFEDMKDEIIKLFAEQICTLKNCESIAAIDAIETCFKNMYAGYIDNIRNDS